MFTLRLGRISGMFYFLMQLCNAESVHLFLRARSPTGRLLSLISHMRYIHFKGGIRSSARKILFRYLKARSTDSHGHGISCWSYYTDVMGYYIAWEPPGDARKEGIVYGNVWGRG